MTKDEALKMARTALGVQLDALLGKAGHLRNDDRRRYAENGIKTIDEALAQPEQECKSPEPKARRPDVHCPDKTCGFLGECRFGYKPEQEPVAFEKTVCPFCTSEWVTAEQHDRNVDRVERKPLTDEEIDKAWRSCDYTVPWEQHRIDIARAIEAAHGIKGEA